MKLYEVPKDYKKKAQLRDFIIGNCRLGSLGIRNGVVVGETDPWESHTALCLIIAITEGDSRVVVGVEDDKIVALGYFDIVDPSLASTMNIGAIVTSVNNPRAIALPAIFLDLLIDAGLKAGVRNFRIDAAVHDIERHQLFESKEFKKTRVCFERNSPQGQESNEVVEPVEGRLNSMVPQFSF